MNYLYYDRSQSIEILEYAYFLSEAHRLLQEKNTSKNILIEEFLASLRNIKYWQFRKVEDYVVSLGDYVFWQSRDIYLQSMEKFVAGKLSGTQFTNNVYYTLLSDKQESAILVKDFEKQKTLELNREIFQFSKLITSFEDVLMIYNLEPDSENLTKDRLREIVREQLPKVREYFTNEISLVKYSR